VPNTDRDIVYPVLEDKKPVSTDFFLNFYFEKKVKTLKLMLKIEKVYSW